MDNFDVCPECDGELTVADSFDQRQDEDVGPLQGYRFECAECDHEPVLAILHYPNHEYVGIRRPPEGERCGCENGATYLVERSGRPAEFYCGMCVFDLYSKCFVETVKTLN